MVWLYLPEVEDSNSDSPLLSELITEQSPTLKGSVRPLRSWLRTWKEGGWIKHLSGMTLQPSQAMSLAHSWITSTLSQQDSPASRGRSQETEKDLKMNDGSGLTSSDWFARYDPEASSWRTSQASFMEELNTFSETWPWSGSMRNGEVSERQTLVRPTAESGSLSWASPADSAQGDIENENENTKYVTTGTGRLRKISNNGESGSLGLAREVKHWATPLASDDGHKVTVNSNQAGLIGEADQFSGRQVQQALSGEKSKSDTPNLPRLNPKFVEWLMGWPEGWLVLTNSESSATE